MSVICPQLDIKTPLDSVYGTDHIVCISGIFSSIINNNGHIVFIKDCPADDIKHHDEDYMIYKLSLYDSNWKAIQLKCGDEIALVAFRLPDGIEMWSVNEDRVITSRCPRCSHMFSCAAVKIYIDSNFNGDIVSINRKAKLVEKQLEFMKSITKARLLYGETVDGASLSVYTNAKGVEITKLNIDI